MTAHIKPTTPSQPVVDEWGFYDPDQAGLAAVLERLDARRAAPTDDARAFAASMRVASRFQQAK